MDSLIKLIWLKDRENVRRYLEKGVPINEPDRDGRTALMHAVLEKDEEMVELLLKFGAAPNVHDHGGFTALHFAAQEYLPAIVEMLILYGSEVDAIDDHGNTPLVKAVFESRGRMDVIGILSRAGADKNKENKHGVSPSSLAKSIANYKIEL